MTVNIGDKPNDPVVGVSDLLIHLSGEQMGKKASEVIKGESLDVLIEAYRDQKRTRTTRISRRE